MYCLRSCSNIVFSFIVSTIIIIRVISMILFWFKCVLFDSPTLSPYFHGPKTIFNVLKQHCLSCNGFRNFGATSTKIIQTLIWKFRCHFWSLLLSYSQLRTNGCVPVNFRICVNEIMCTFFCMHTRIHVWYVPACSSAMAQWHLTES